MQDGVDSVSGEDDKFLVPKKLIFPSDVTEASILLSNVKIKLEISRFH